MDDNPGELIPAELREAGEGDAVKINLNQPMADILKELTKYPVATRLSLNGTIIVGRDIAHAKLKERIDNGEDLPQYIKDPYKTFLENKLRSYFDFTGCPIQIYMRQK
jgi:fumarate hydratase class I